MKYIILIFNESHLKQKKRIKERERETLECLLKRYKLIYVNLIFNFYF